MDKKWIIIICIVILLVIGLIAYYSFFTNQENTVKIGDTTFKLSNGYHKVASNNENITNLTNGTNNIYIEKYDDPHMKKYIKSYVSFSEKNNRSVELSKFTVGDTLVYKSNLNTSDTVHYWFVKNNHTFTLYSWDQNPEIDSATIKIIESTS